MFKQVHEDTVRSEDVRSGVSSFKDLMVDPRICEALKRYHQIEPTPVQAKSLPLLMFGTDALIQAKAGTGKTLVYSVLAAKALYDAPTRQSTPHVLIVTPTREIALQSNESIERLLPYGCKSILCVGQTNAKQNRVALRAGAQCVVGTCGRLVQLLHINALDLSHIELFVLDEADQLMDDDFEKDINLLFSALPTEMKQVLVFSATYPARIEALLKRYMREPELIKINFENEQLVAMMEYVVICDQLDKAQSLLRILETLVYKQCIIFCESAKLADEVQIYLKECGQNSEVINGKREQSERFDIVKRFRDLNLRLLVATDLAARGVDFPGVDLVINVSVAPDANTAMHRQGRAGRYGARGVTITLLLNEREASHVLNFVDEKNLNIRVLDIESDDLPYDLIYESTHFDLAMPIHDHPIIKAVIQLKSNKVGAYEKRNKSKEAVITTAANSARTTTSQSRAEFASNTRYQERLIPDEPDQSSRTSSASKVMHKPRPTPTYLLIESPNDALYEPPPLDETIKRYSSKQMIEVLDAEDLSTHQQRSRYMESWNDWSEISDALWESLYEIGNFHERRYRNIEACQEPAGYIYEVINKRRNTQMRAEAMTEMSVKEQNGEEQRQLAAALTDVVIEPPQFDDAPVNTPMTHAPPQPTSVYDTSPQQGPSTVAPALVNEQPVGKIQDKPSPPQEVPSQPETHPILQLDESSDASDLFQPQTRQRDQTQHSAYMLQLQDLFNAARL